MNLKRLVSLVLVFLFMGVIAQAQTTFYVNNTPGQGSDGYNGLHQTYQGDGINGPKLTVTNAIAAAVAGDEIVIVGGTGVFYGEATVAVTKELDFRVVSGNATFTGANGWDINLPAPGDEVAFLGPNQLIINNGLELLVGDVDGGNFLTVGTSVYRTEDGQITSGQLNYTGVVDFEYENVGTAAGFTFTTGLEFPPTADVASAGDLTTSATAGDADLDLNQTKTINGILTTGAGANNGILDLNGYTLNIVGANSHLVDGDVIDGTLAFDMQGGNADIDGVTGAESLPNITATDDGAGRTLTVNPGTGIVDVGNLTANGDANIVANNTGTIENVVNNSDGDITTNNNDANAVGYNTNNVTLAGSGNITLNRAVAGAHTVDGDILVSGYGILTWGGGVNAINVTGDVTLSTTINLSDAGAQTDIAQINFTNDPTDIGGNVSNSVTVTGTSQDGLDNDDAGNITFGAVNNNVNIDGTVLVDGSGAPVAQAGSIVDKVGNIYFAFVGSGANTFTANDITNSSNFTVSATNCGIIQFTGNWADPVTVDDVLNTSTSIAGNGFIDFNSAATGDLTTGSIETSGATAASNANGASIELGNSTLGGAAATIQINGSVTNSRSVAGSDILVDASTNLLLTLNITGGVTNSGASDILFVFEDTTPDDVDIDGTVVSSGAGTIDFANLISGTFQAGGINVSNGLVDLSDYDGLGGNLIAGAVLLTGGTLDASGLNGGDFVATTFTMSGGNHDINSGGADNVIVQGNVSLTNGTLDLAGITAFTTSGTLITFGGVNTNPTFTNAGLVSFALNEPVPNVLQTFNVGSQFPEWPGDLDVINPADIIGTVVQFTGGDMLVSGNLTFNTNRVNNAVLLDGARIYLGDNTVPASGGALINTTGYRTVNSGRVVMSGSQAQQVTHGGAGIYFGGFEVDNSAGTGAPNDDVFIQTQNTDEANALFIDFFYLTQGTVEGQDVQFVSVGGSVPHIVRNNGLFDVEPLFSNLVDVSYIGTEKATDDELPTANNRLRNLTIATTNHTVTPGYGVVELSKAITVNGTLTVYAKQNLFLNGFDLTMAGSTVNVNGTAGDATTYGAIVGASIADELVLAAPGGVMVNGPGYLPSIRVADNSIGNQVNNNIIGLFANLFVGGAANQRNAAAGDNFTLGDITFVGGANGSDLFVSFSGNGPHFDNLFTAQNATFTIGADQVMEGDIDHNSNAAIDLGGNTLEVQGSLFLAGTTTTDNGTLLFVTDDEAIVVDNGTGPATIDADVTVDILSSNAVANDNDFTIGGTAEELIIAGTFLLNDQLFLAPANIEGVALNILGGETLTLAGNVATVSANSTVTTTGTGLLRLQPAAGTLAFTIPNIAIGNVQVNGDVDLLGLILGNVLVMNNFTHTSGLLNFSTADLQVNTLYTRGTGTYTGTGWLIWNGGAAANFNHGATDFDINNLQFATDALLDEAGVITVNTNLHLNDAAVTINPAGRLVVGDGALVTATEGGGGVDVITNPLVFAGNVDFEFDGGVLLNPVPVNLWPAAPFMGAQEVEVSGAGGVEIDEDRYIGNRLTLSNLGDFRWDDPVDLEIVDQGFVRRTNNGGVLNNNADGVLVPLQVGTFTTGTLNLEYQNAGMFTHFEYTNANIIGTLTLLTAGTVLTIDDAGETVTGLVTLNSTLNVNANTTFTMPLNIPDESIVNIGAAATGTFSNGIVVAPDANAAGNNGGTLGVTGTLGIPSGGLEVNGTMTASGTVNVTDGMTLGAGGTYASVGGTDILNLDALTNGGALGFQDGSTINMTGPASFGAVNFSAPAAPVVPVVLNTPSDVNFNGVVTNGANLDINFTGANPQAVTLAANLGVNNLTLNKTANEVVTVSGGNLTVNGLLTLTWGILDAVTNNVIVNLFDANADGIIDGVGYLRNPANIANAAHVVGNLGMAVPAGVIGRIEYPVGALNGDYRPAAITFTAGNATIAPTTIFVGHMDAEPLGVVGLPLDGGVKFADPNEPNLIGGKAPYGWRVRSTTSLGAAQRFDLELVGTRVRRPFQDVENLRIIRRFDGDVNVNAWSIQGSNDNYSNIMQENVPNVGDTLLTVRNQNSQGGIVTQAAIYTLGIPTQPPVFTAKGSDDPLANRTINENDTYTFAYQAADLDANPQAIVYSVEGVTPAVPDSSYSIDSATGDFEFTPSFDLVLAGDEDFTFVVQAMKAGDSTFVTDQLLINVTHVNRAPSIDSLLADTTNVQILNEFAHEFVSSDPDAGQTLTWALTVDPTGGAATINPATGMFSWTPDTADAGNDYTFTVTVTDDDAAPLADATTFTLSVGYDRVKGDINGDGNVDLLDALLALDAAIEKIVLSGLEHWAGDMDDDGDVTLLDALAILDVWTGGPMAASGGKPTSNILSKIQSYNAIASFGKLDVDQESRVIHLPVNLSNVEGIRAFGFDVELSMEVESITPLFNMPSEWLTASNYKNGKLMIGAIGLEDLASDLVLTLEIVLKDKKDKVSLSGIAKINGKDQVLNQVTVQEIPNRFDLSQNYPNPFNPSTIIKYDLAENVNVTMKIYNIAGQEVATIVSGLQEAGSYQVRWDGTNNFGSKVAAGLYIYRLEAGPFTSVKKMMLIK